MTSVSPAVSSTADRAFAGRQTRRSNEAEQAILGAMLLDQDAALKAAELLDDTMFYKEGHRALFRAMTGLAERGDVIDPVTLRDELGRRGDLDRAGGMEYIGALIDVVPTAANVEYHCRIVRDKAVQRPHRGRDLDHSGRLRRPRHGGRGARQRRAPRLPGRP